MKQYIKQQIRKCRNINEADISIEDRCNERIADFICPYNHNKKYCGKEVHKPKVNRVQCHYKLAKYDATTNCNSCQGYNTNCRRYLGIIPIKARIERLREDKYSKAVQRLSSYAKKIKVALSFGSYPNLEQIIINQLIFKTEEIKGGEYK